MEIFRYRGFGADSLLRWLIDLDGAREARCIDDELIKFSFAHPYLVESTIKLGPVSRVALPRCVWVAKDIEVPALRDV